MSVEKRADGYTVRWRDASGRQRSQQVSRWKDAVALDGEVKRKKALGELAGRDHNLELGQLWDQWWTMYAEVHTTDRTRESYKILWDLYIPKRLKWKQVKLLDQQDFDRLVYEMSKHLAPSTVRKVLAVAQNVLQRGVEWHYVNTNPVAGVKRPRLTGTQRRGVVVTRDEFDQIAARIPGLRSWSFASVLYHTGMRPGEARGLRWGDVRPDRLMILRAVSSNKLGPTKTRIERWVPLSADLKNTLSVWWAACAKPAMTALIFPAVDSTKIWSDNAYRLWVQKVFVPTAAKTGLALRPYDLRHTYISRRISEGADVVALSREVGNSPDVLLKTYAHEFESVREECAGEVDLAMILELSP